MIEVGKTESRRRKVIFKCKVALILFIISYWAIIFIDFDVAFNNEKVTMWIHAPSIVEADEEFEIIVEAWDKYERLAGSYKGEISFGIESYNFTTLNSMSSSSELPESKTFTSNFIWGGLIPAYEFGDADNGKKTFKMSISTLGIHYIQIEEENGDEYRSNPIIVKKKGSDYKQLFWGDIHTHSILSDGSGTPDDAYEFARDVSLLDYAALTDHSELFPRLGDKGDLFNQFQNYIDTTNNFNDKGDFITLIAMEYTPMLAMDRSYLSPAHLNVYFKGNKMPFFSSYDQINPEELYDYIDDHTDGDFISWTHHATRDSQPSDFGYYDEDINTMVEIYSCHGSSEVIGDENIYEAIGEVSESGYSIRDGLKMGRKFGIMAASDTHDGRIGHSILHTKARTLTQQPYTLSAYRYGVPYRGGLTGLYISELSRNNVFNGLKTRSGYATTWVNRHIVNFSINGLTIGVNDSTLIVPKTNSTREIEIFVCIDGVSMNPNEKTLITKIEVIKNSKTWKTYDDIDEPIYRIKVNDTSNITGTKYKDCIQKNDGEWYVHKDSTKSVDPDKLSTHGVDYYYVRIQDSEGGAAWIGPIWVEVNN